MAMIFFGGTATVSWGGGAAETAQPLTPKQTATHPTTRERSWWKLR